MQQNALTLNIDIIVSLSNITYIKTILWRRNGKFV